MDLSPKRTDRVEGTAYIVAKELYILDEPCKGLHYRDITKIVKATKDLIHRGNTVIAIEHNTIYLIFRLYSRTWACWGGLMEDT